MLGIAFAVITTVIPTIDATLSIADRFVGSKDEVAISITGNGNHVIIDVYDGSTPKIDYYFENEQTKKKPKRTPCKNKALLLQLPRRAQSAMVISQLINKVY